ncbi:MAG: carboxypeptidase regulatory-like domain-containing protein [Bryobacterales bacterium]|nr:carboxypeptidase regulatory-like domain-containing protein [Bryobacterales bacterium]
MTSLSGTVTDPTGAVTPNAAITVNDINRGLTRSTNSDPDGRYSFPQIPPGNYRLVAKMTGFADVVIESLELQVNTPATVNLELRQVSGVAETVTVSAQTTQLNATDASLGNAIGTKEVLQLPMYLRNVVGLLTFQPGVTSFNESSTDDRNGSVNGGRADQANVTLDGIDVNDHHNRRAFTSILRLSLDSVSEFRTTTANAGADQGRTSGADIALVTKSGTNDLHGSLYDFHRNTVTSANSFFNNRAGVKKPALLVDVFGAAVGGPIRKNRLFFFLNYEGRRDRSATGVLRTVPSAELRQGIVQYKTTAGGVARLTPDDLKARVDPAGIGASAPFLEYMKSYPLPNDFTVGDGLNVAGFRFTAPQKSKYDLYTTRLDYAIDGAGKHTMFWRGNMQNERTIGVPQFAGDPPNSVSLDNTKGFALGWNASWRPNLIATTRFGLTRAGSETTGVQTRNFVIPNGWDSRYATSRGVSRIIPSYHWSQDLTWTRGRHEWRFGGNVRRIRNSSLNFGNSFHTVQMWQGWLRGSASEFDAAAPGLDRSFNSAYRTAVGHTLGLIPQGIARYNYDISGGVIPSGTPLERKFGNEEYDFYGQDTWKIARSVTVTVGLRYLLAPPVREVNGLEVTTNHRLGEWAGLRYWLGNQGRSQAEVAPLTYIASNSAGGRPLYPYQKKNLAPRFSIAWSPSSDRGWLRKLTGGAGRTSIRAGWGMFYDQLGQPLMTYLSNSASFGLSSSISNPAGTLTSLTAPRFTGAFDIPAQLIRPAPPGGLPQEAPKIQATTAGIDDHMRIPYSMNMNLSVAREFNNGLFVQASYVGRLARSTPLERDLALHTNLKDPQSGVYYFQAAEQMLDMWRRNVPVAQVGRIPYWENLWPAAARNGLTATQSIYNVFRTYNVDTSAVTYDIDINCDPACSRFGPFSMFNEQIASYTAYTSDGRGNYNALQLTVRKKLGNDLRLDMNYTWSKSIDFSSNTPRSPGGLNLAQNWDPRDRRAVSDYDVRHSVNAFAIWEMPFGKGKKFLSGSPGIVNAILGGWQLSGSWFQTSGLVTFVNNGSVWPTSWGPAPYATQISTPVQQSTKNAPAVIGAGGPNIFPDPSAGLKSFDFTLPGITGSRNTLRGDGTFVINMGVMKRFFMPYSERHSMQFRWESFNLPNTVRFDPRSASLSLTSVGTFGKYTGVLNSPRQMQFGLRYEF